MVVKQYYLGCLAHASYLIADPPSGEAAVVDRNATSSSTSRTRASSAAESRACS